MPYIKIQQLHTTFFWLVNNFIINFWKQWPKKKHLFFYLVVNLNRTYPARPGHLTVSGMNLQDPPSIICAFSGPPAPWHCSSNSSKSSAARRWSSWRSVMGGFGCPRDGHMCYPVAYTSGPKSHLVLSRHPNTCSGCVLGVFWGSKYLLRRCLDV